MYNVVIVGGGPAGVAAGVYAARKKMKCLFVTESFGGQSLVSNDIQNWIGTPSVSGFDFSKMLEGHLKAQEGVEIIEGDRVRMVKKLSKGFRVATDGGKSVETMTVLLASGSRRKKLGVPGEKELEGKGVIYCTTCDAPLFGGKTTAVIGGGNAGLEGALDLLAYSPKVYILEYGDALRGDSVTQEKLKQNPRVTIITSAKTLKIVGDGLVRGLQYEDRVTGAVRDLTVEGIAVEIGSLPNSEFVKDLVELNSYGEVVVDHKTQRTSREGVWAAGDVCDVLYKQNNISAGDAVKAVLNIYDYLQKNNDI